MRTVYGNHQRFETTYFKKFPGYYVTGDGEGPARWCPVVPPLLFRHSGLCPGCRRDKDGYYWITGRIDDMLNVSGKTEQT